MKGRCIAASLLLLACGDYGDPTEPWPRGDLDGVWSFEQSVVNQSEAVGCLLRGSMHIAQNGGSITGELELNESSCTYLIDGGAPNGPEFGTAPIDFGSALGAGTLSGGTLSLQSASCTYEGQASGTPAQRIDGTTTCTLTIEGEYDAVPVYGMWTALR